MAQTADSSAPEASAAHGKLYRVLISAPVFAESEHDAINMGLQMSCCIESGHLEMVTLFGPDGRTVVDEDAGFRSLNVPWKAWLKDGGIVLPSGEDMRSFGLIEEG